MIDPQVSSMFQRLLQDFNDLIQRRELFASHTAYMFHQPRRRIIICSTTEVLVGVCISPIQQSPIDPRSFCPYIQCHAQRKKTKEVDVPPTRKDSLTISTVKTITLFNNSFISWVERSRDKGGKHKQKNQ